MSNKKEKKPFYKKWWFIALVVFVVIGAIGGGEDEDEAAEDTQDETEEVTEEVEAEDETADESEQNIEEEPVEEEVEGLTDEELSNLEEDITNEVSNSEDNLSVHSFEYEDGLVSVWVDMQNDPLPTKEEAEDILAGVTWHLAELTEVEVSEDYDVNALLVTSTDDGFLHWLTDRYRDGEYDMTEEDAFDILPN